jgi:hypothetical protein
MYRDFYAGHDLLAFPLFALLFFVAVFAAVLVRLFVSGRKDPRYDLLATLPLDDAPAPRARGDLDV